MHSSTDYSADVSISGSRRRRRGGCVGGSSSSSFIVSSLAVAVVAVVAIIMTTTTTTTTHALSTITQPSKPLRQQQQQQHRRRTISPSPGVSLGPKKEEEEEEDVSGVFREDAVKLRTTSKRSTRSNPLLWYNEKYDELDTDEDDDEDLIQESIPSFRSLKDSIHREILDSDTQSQIDSGTWHALPDTSELERIAMNSITEQLPQPVVKRQKQSMDYSNHRVSAQQEIALAKQIQTGVRLYKIRNELLAQKQQQTSSTTTSDNDVSKAEWAKAANMSPKELRHHIVCYRRAKQELVTANLGLVHTVVKQLQHKFPPGTNYHELVQEGSLGLLRAAELFDPNRGLRFSTYAVVWIKGILSNSNKFDFVVTPTREKNKWHKILAASSVTPDQSVEEIAANTGLTVSEIRDIRQRMRTLERVQSLDAPRFVQSRSGTETSRGGTMEESSSIPSSLVDSEEDVMTQQLQLRSDLIAALARNLSPREARLVRLRFGLNNDGIPRSYQECADAMGLSYARVHQLSQQCLAKLRQAAEAESLAEYLLTIA
jgi:RNA polymerase sigma factor (sigma-70 family)